MRVVVCILSFYIFALATVETVCTARWSVKLAVCSHGLPIVLITFVLTFVVVAVFVAPAVF